MPIVDFENRMRDMLDDYDEFLKSMNEAPQNGIRVNERKCNAGGLDICANLKPVEWCSIGFYADKSVISGKHPYHHAGLFYFQEPSAMAVGETLRFAGVKSDDKILDLCAAPGGKSTHIGAMLAKEGILVSNEVNLKRAYILAENIERFGINAVVISEFPEKLEKRFSGFFNKIVVDAPCSGEGMFRKEPQALTDWSIAHTESCSVRQLAILNSAAKMLDNDGYIIYSTCTFAPCENEGIIFRFLKDNPDFELCDIPVLDMLSAGSDKYINAEFDELSKTRRIFPHRHNGEGHFIALLHFCGENKKSVCNIKPAEKPKEAISVFREFEKKNLNFRFNGYFELFGDNLYIRDERIGSLDKIKTVRAGLHLGQCKKSERGKMRFEPSYALAHYLNRENIKNSVSYNADDPHIYDYLCGREICDDSAADGWCAVCVDGFVLGWGKASNGVIKNKYPKNLREKG